MSDKIAITQGKGFHLSIGKYTISVQLGHNNYCTRRNYNNFGLETEPEIESPDCEVAVWTGEDEDWVTREVIKKALKETIDDDVMGWVTPLQVGQIIAWMTKQELKQQKHRNT